MKKALLLVLLAGLFTSCKKEKNQAATTTPPDHIIAGQQTRPGIEFQEIDVVMKYVHSRPDTLVAVDLDKDGLTDFSVRYFLHISPGGKSIYYSVIPEANVQIAVDYNEPQFALALDSGDRIDVVLNWSGDTCTMLYKTGGFCGQKDEGRWQLKDEKYLGVKLITNNSEVYAWVKVMTEMYFYQFNIHSSGVASGNRHHH